jgi:hypothetical protein
MTPESPSTVACLPLPAWNVKGIFAPVVLPLASGPSGLCLTHKTTDSRMNVPTMSPYEICASREGLDFDAMDQNGNKAPVEIMVRTREAGLSCRKILLVICTDWQELKLS